MVPKNALVTEFHVMLLYPDRVKGIKLGLMCIVYCLKTLIVILFILMLMQVLTILLGTHPRLVCFANIVHIVN